MKILYFKKNEAKIQIEDISDLWYFNAIVDPGDIISGRTLRKIKLEGAEERARKAIKKPVFLSIEVEKIEFHKYSDVLRIAGKVIEGPEDIPRGSYHTFNVEEDTIIKIKKPKWYNYQKEKLDEASKKEKPKILLVVHDREEAHFALMKRYGYDYLLNLKGVVEKKPSVIKKEKQQQVVAKNFYVEIIEQIKEYIKRYGIETVVIASPAFWKEDLMKNVKEDNLKKRIVLATVASCDKSSFNELLKRKEVQTALKQEKAAEEIRLVEKLLDEISKNGLYAYGIKETKTAVEAGAVQDFLITDKFIFKSRESPEEFEKIDKLMKMAEKTKAKIHIISSDHDGGKKLDGLGGIGAILRYKLNY